VQNIRRRLNYHFGPLVALPYGVNDRKRELLAEKLLDLGNYAVLALWFSQIVATIPDWDIAFFGVFFWALCCLIMNVILP
jgi:hypothetical protein